MLWHWNFDSAIIILMLKCDSRKPTSIWTFVPPLPNQIAQVKCWFLISSIRRKTLHYCEWTICIWLYIINWSLKCCPVTSETIHLPSQVQSHSSNFLLHFIVFNFPAKLHHLVEKPKRRKRTQGGFPSMECNLSSQSDLRQHSRHPDDRGKRTRETKAPGE